MNTQSFRPTAEALESRDAPVILMIVLPALPLLEIKGITFVHDTDPQHTEEVRITSRGCTVSLTLSPDDPR